MVQQISKWLEHGLSKELKSCCTKFSKRKYRQLTLSIKNYLGI